jgi:hypothetical protein
VLTGGIASLIPRLHAAAPSGQNSAFGTAEDKRFDPSGENSVFGIVVDSSCCGEDAIPESKSGSVILSEAKDLLRKRSQQVEEILRFAQNDRLIFFPR